MSVLLEVDDLRISASNDDGELTPIVKGVNFSVSRGEVVALIGESGSGKTTIALASLGYTKPGLEFVGGEVRFHRLAQPHRFLPQLRLISLAELKRFGDVAAPGYQNQPEVARIVHQQHLTE